LTKAQSLSCSKR